MDASRTGSRPREIVQVIFDHELQNCPGKSIVGLKLEYPPGGFTPPHRHAGAQVAAFVTGGSILSGMNSNPPKVYGPGDSFAELPGCHHTVGENSSQEERARFFAIFVVDTAVVKEGYDNLTQLDDGWE